MKIWSAEIKELEVLYTSMKGHLPDLERELERLIKTDDENIVLVYARRCLEVIITDLCESELKRPRKTEPLKGIIDKLNREEKVPEHIIAYMHSLNSLSTFGAHPKEFDPKQVKPVLINLSTILEWYLKYKNIGVDKTVQKKEDEPRIIARDKDYLKVESYSKPEKSIIVLPFENMSPDLDQEYFSDGLTEEIITDLSHIRDLLVISRSSAMTFKGTKKKIGEIARDVNVRYVLEGSVRKAGNNLRITAQLIDASNDSHLWAEKYIGTLEDIFDIQEKVSRSIVDSLELKLNLNEDQRLMEHPIKDLIAFETYLKAKYKLTSWTEDNIDDAIILLERALQIEGPNELLYATMGFAYTQYCSPLPLKPVEAVLTKAESYANKVLELNSDSPEGHALQGTILFHQGKTQEAIMHLKKSYEMNSQNITVLMSLGIISGISGHLDTSRFYYKKLSAIEPWSGVNPSWFDFYSGNFEKSISGYHKEYKMEPESPYTRWAYGSVLAWALHTDEACIILEQIVKDTPHTMYGQYASFLLNALRGNTVEACRVITPEIASSWKNQWQMPWMVASIYSMMGKTDESLDWLEHAINRGFINYPFLNEYDSFLTKMRGNPRYEKLMERVKYEWENFEI